MSRREIFLSVAAILLLQIAVLQWGWAQSPHTSATLKASCLANGSIKIEVVPMPLP